MPAPTPVPKYFSAKSILPEIWSVIVTEYFINKIPAIKMRGEKKKRIRGLFILVLLTGPVPVGLKASGAGHVPFALLMNMARGRAMYLSGANGTWWVWQGSNLRPRHYQ